MHARTHARARAHARTHARTLHAYCVILSIKTGTAAISWNNTSHDDDGFGNEAEDQAVLVKGHVNLDNVQTSRLHPEDSQVELYPQTRVVLISSPGDKC